MRPGAHPEDIRGRQRESYRVGNGIREDRTGRKVWASDMVDWIEPTVQDHSAEMVDREATVVRGHTVDVADWVEAMTRRTSSSVEDRMAPTVRDHSAGMVGRKATVVCMDGMVLLEVEDEAEQATRALRARLAAFAENLAFCPLFWHIPVDVRLGGGGCREDFRP